MFNVVLLNPKIPQNTGSIGRSCVCTGSRLHVIGPTPIDFDEKRLRRAGMDYWAALDFFFYADLAHFLSAHPISDRHFFFTTKTDRLYFDAAFQPGDFFWFGSEDEGLPQKLLGANSTQTLTLPMKAGFRSLNLASTATTVLYEGVRQNYSPEAFR
jgi:tRNA (cytidine/uridine-2'-O-)-methyltransferase